MLLDPNQALANESLGLLCMSDGKRDEARKWFAQAVRLDSKSFLAHYYAATLQMEAAQSEEEVARVAAGLQRAIELNPEFAPAYASLAGFHSMRNVHLARALSLAQKAMELEPSVVAYQLSVSQIAAQLGHIDDALKLAERVLAGSKSPSDREMAQNFLRELRE